MAKLDLQQALEGIKLGLSRHHAVECLKTLEDPGEAVILKNHLALYDAAVKLSPAEIKSATDEEVAAGLKTLEGADVSWTEALQWHLWRRRCKKAQTALTAEVLPEPFQAWWDLVRPYSYNADEQKLSIHAPTLCAIAGSAASKTQTFLQSVFTDLLLPSLIEGEMVAERVSSLCGCILRSIDSDFLKEIDETYIPCLPQIKDALLGLKALLSKDLHVQFEHKEQIADLRWAMTSQVRDHNHQVRKGAGRCASLSRLGRLVCGASAEH